MKSLLGRSIADLLEMLPRMAALDEPLQRLGDAMLACWKGRGKVLVAGNGGSAADAMHFAEELVVRYRKNRRGLAAQALCDPTVLTCAGNDFGYESVFERQVEAFGNPGDIFVLITTSGNSVNLLRAADRAKVAGLITCAFLGGTGGKAKGKYDIELVVPSTDTARIQEGHKILIHTLCEWVDQRVD